MTVGSSESGKHRAKVGKLGRIPMEGNDLDGGSHNIGIDNLVIQNISFRMITKCLCMFLLYLFVALYWY